MGSGVHSTQFLLENMKEITLTSSSGTRLSAQHEFKRKSLEFCFEFCYSMVITGKCVRSICRSFRFRHRFFFLMLKVLCIKTTLHKRTNSERNTQTSCIFQLRLLSEIQIDSNIFKFTVITSKCLEIRAQSFRLLITNS